MTDPYWVDLLSSFVVDRRAPGITTEMYRHIRLVVAPILVLQAT